MKYVENYWVEELPNGVIHLLINCTQREIYYHAYNDISFLICGTEEEFEEEGWGSSTCILETKEFLPNKENISYTITSVKEKDQLSFYWIPFERGKRRDRKILLDVTL
jgi:hypothetical protein